MPQGSWRPTEVTRPIAQFHTSTRPVHVDTDRGQALVKAANSPRTANALVCEWIGHRLADEMGLRTFDYAVLPGGYAGELEQEPLDLAGPLFAVRWVEGDNWSGDARDLDTLAHKEDVAGLILLDTWLRNPDRRSVRVENKDNVFLEVVGPARRLVAMDFSLLLDVLAIVAGRPATPNDPADYTRFPAFDPCLTPRFCAQMLAAMEAVPRATVDQIIDEIPPGWGVDRATSDVLKEELWKRRDFLAGTFRHRPDWPGIV